MRNKLKNRRISRGKTQAQIAELVGISRAFYTEIETGKKNCNFAIWVKIGKVLQIPENEMFSYIIENADKLQEDRRKCKK